MIRRVLVANRGEIALRVMRACDEMGIETVAVYSDADAIAPHVRAAGRAVRIGTAPPLDSYLNIGKIIAAARDTGAGAIHPGYGFLAENAAFAAACEEAGIVFVGPPAGVISRMGSKIESRRIMREAGIPVVPGEAPEDQSDAALSAAAVRAGFPLLVKASAGGGGKGMRVVRAEEDFGAAVSSARSEARNAFGDGTLYVERLVEHPRHVEIQLIADNAGHIVHLFERDCSVQRRHQKIVEETPSPVLTSGMRARMGAAAVAAARAVGYRNAGTVEFLVEGAGDTARFYFLEMNTRLQVEHPITEAVVGVDLVRAQLLVASGENLPWQQGDLAQRGHAVECRICAEDPARGFLPQAGTLSVYRQPVRPGVRIDSGVAEGAEVSVYYDSLMAKLIAHAESRELAIARAREALRGFPILGLATNIPFLLRVLGHPRFLDGTMDTAFLDADSSSLTQASPLPAAALAAAVLHTDRDSDMSGSVRRPDAVSSDPWAGLPAWRSLSS
jgi:acetyl-CoA carboxylase biotin carboxylase subunit